MHLSVAAKDDLLLLERLTFSYVQTESFILEPWTQALDKELASSPGGDVDYPFTSPYLGAQTILKTLGFEGISSECIGRSSMRARIPSTVSEGGVEWLVLSPNTSLDEFRDYLAEHNVDVWRFGRGQAMSLQDFHRRVVLERRARLCMGASGLEQRVELIRINLIARAPDGKDKQLALTSTILADGRCHSRNVKFAHAVVAGTAVEQALEECFTRRLRVPQGLLAELFVREPGIVCVNQERRASQSAPGMLSTYAVQEVTVRISDPTSKVLKHLGMPHFDAFNIPASAGTAETNWAWHEAGSEWSAHSGLAYLFERHGIDINSYPVSAFSEMFDEVYNAKVATLAVREDRQLERRMNVIKVWLSADLLSIEHVLVKRWQFEKGISDTQAKDRPVSMRMAMDQPWEEAVRMNVMDNLGLDIDFQRQHLSIDERSYRISEEVGNSNRYPGLRTLYCIHECKCRILNPMASGMEVIGLPGGIDFVVMRNRQAKTPSEAPGESMVTGWSWKPVESLGRSLHKSFSRRTLLDRPAMDSEFTQKRRLPVPEPLQATAREEQEAVGGEAASAPCEASGLQLPVEISRCSTPPRNVLQEVMHGRKPNLERALTAAQRIRDENYTCRQYFEDCVAAFPELALYISGQDGDDGTLPATQSGRTAEDEYQRTIGALFAVYWLMRLSLDGRQSFCFGVDDDWYPLSADSQMPERSTSEKQKRQAFFEKTKWEELEQLFVDAGILKPNPEGSGLTHDVDRTLAMLVLTAIHDIMKVSALCPIVAEGNGPWSGYKVGEKVGDHDAALAYILEYEPDVLPSFAMLPRAHRRSLKFTQCKMEYNMGWLVQAEAPPGALFSRFKRVMLSGEANPADVAFYFVHWLTDLAGAEPCPQEGMEKFVLMFPHKVLGAFSSSFSIVQNLSTKSETEVFEDYLQWRWKSTEGRLLGPAPTGPGSIARLRIVVMAQGSTQQMLNAFRAVPREDLVVLEEELALTGCVGQAYKNEQVGLRTSVGSPGPAILVYYAPALMQKAGKTDPVGALCVLADVFRQGRSLFPSNPARAGETIILRIDALKDLEVREIRESASPGDVWVLEKVSSKDAQVRRVNMVKHRQEGLNWETSRILFAYVPKHSGTRSENWGLARNAVKKATSAKVTCALPRPSSNSPVSMNRTIDGCFWRRFHSEKVDIAVAPARGGMYPTEPMPAVHEAGREAVVPAAAAIAAALAAMTGAFPHPGAKAAARPASPKRVSRRATEPSLEPLL